MMERDVIYIADDDTKRPGTQQINVHIKHVLVPHKVDKSYRMGYFIHAIRSLLSSLSLSLARSLCHLYTTPRSILLFSLFPCLVPLYTRLNRLLFSSHHHGKGQVGYCKECQHPEKDSMERHRHQTQIAKSSRFNSVSSFTGISKVCQHHCVVHLVQ